MNGRDLAADLRFQAPLPIDRKALMDLLEAANVLRQENTHVAGWIRVLSLDGVILVQEETPDGHALVRRMPSLETAGQFVDRRLDAYERACDGCG